MGDAWPACVRDNQPLAQRTTLRIGGPVRWLAEPRDMDEVREALDFAAGRGLRVLPLGGGSNILAADDPLEALALRLSPQGEFAAIVRDETDPDLWRAGAAAGLQALVRATTGAGAAGLEGLAGIPGTVGGAVRMNAGGHGGAIGDVVHALRVVGLADGSIREIAAGDAHFAYRHADLDGCLVIEAVVRLVGRNDPAALAQAVRETREKKAASQPLDLPSAGCVFKNPPGDAAGRLIDAAGCKGLRVGAAEVSDRHANFIVNHGGATCDDFCRLATTVRERVRAMFGVELEREIRVWR